MDYDDIARDPFIIKLCMFWLTYKIRIHIFSHLDESVEPV